jgi:hypothetical protein
MEEGGALGTPEALVPYQQHRLVGRQVFGARRLDPVGASREGRPGLREAEQGVSYGLEGDVHGD